MGRALEAEDAFFIETTNFLCYNMRYGRKISANWHSGF